MYYSLEKENGSISTEEVRALIHRHIEENHWSKVLLIPPDITRSHSGSGMITAVYYEVLSKLGCQVNILPALGTHCPMTEKELHEMFGCEIPLDAYLVHDFRNSVKEIGIVPGFYMKEISNSLFQDDVSICMNVELFDDTYDAILSIGQIIPHEIAGLSGYTKNIAVGCGGGELINVSHFLGVIWGLDRILGVDKTPVRLFFDYIENHFLKKLPLTYIQTVMKQEDGVDCYKGIFIGSERRTFEEAARLCRSVNFNHLTRPIHKCVVWMDPHSYHSTWVTNKAIYRTQLAVEQGGEIIIIAPGVRMFGENELADRLIRKYGYLCSEKALKLRETEAELQENLSIVGHLIHGVPEGIQVTYCTDLLTSEEVKKANFHYLTVKEALALYPCENWETGWKTLPGGEEIFFVKNAALGMWRYEKEQGTAYE